MSVTAYQKLHDRFRRLGHLHHVSAIMRWDEAVMMPAAAGSIRADAMAELERVTHELTTQPVLAEWLEEAEASVEGGELDAWQRANLREMRRVYRRSSCLPGELVEASSRARTRCEQAWRGLRPQNDWSSFAPLLQQVLQLEREIARGLSAVLGCSAYEALLDGYEPEARSGEIDRLFRHLRDFLPGFVQQVMSRQSGQQPLSPRGPFSRAGQRQLCERLMRAVGFDHERGRLDSSHHPFCGGVPTDVRITTRYEEADFTKALMAVLHETGHAKYEQGLPEGQYGQPAAASRSMGLHESQSLFLEMQIARSKPFLRFAAPIIRETFARVAETQPSAFDVDNLYELCIRVEPGLIRVDADEVTYPLHVILRYEIERELIDGGMEAADIPRAWDAAMQELLGLSTSGNYRDGCMQDVHWAAGIFGYFPSYVLGAMVAAQLFAAACRELPGLDDDIRVGRLQRIDAWLRENIWSKGSALLTNELILRATGEALTPRHFEQHLRQRYLASA